MRTAQNYNQSLTAIIAFNQYMYLLHSAAVIIIERPTKTKNSWNHNIKRELYSSTTNRADNSIFQFDYLINTLVSNWTQFGYLKGCKVRILNQTILTIRLEAKLQLNIGFTFKRAPYARFYRFPSAKFHEIWTTPRLVSQWTLLEQNFENFPIRGRFSKKGKIRIIFNVFWLQAAVALQSLLIDRNSSPNDPFMGCLVSIFTDGINSVILLACTLHTRNLPQIFCDVGHRLMESPTV